MAITSNSYTGNGSTTLYSFTFPYLDKSHVKVTLNGTLTTAYTFANATTIKFNTAPGAGVAIRIYRETDDSALEAVFSPGSSIRAADLNVDFDQLLYLGQESNNIAEGATTTANTALTNSNTAINTANSAVSTANSAVSAANSAVSTANSASSAAASAVSTANTANSNASAAVSTANSASAAAASAVSTANTASSNASTALSTANTALSNSTAAVSTANTASSNASAAVSTANTASSNASTALSTANSALSTANTALSNSATAISTANAASAAVASAVIYQPVVDLAALALLTPADGDFFELQDSTGADTDPSITGVTAGLVGSPGLTFRLRYDDPPQEYVFLGYFANDSETRYLKLAGGTLTGQLLGDNSTSAATPGYAFDGDPNTGVGRTGADELALITGGVNRLSIDPIGAVDVPGTISSDTITTKGNVQVSRSGVVKTLLSDAGSYTLEDFSAGRFIVTGGTVPTNGVYLPAANSVGISTNGTQRLTIDGSGNVISAGDFYANGTNGVVLFSSDPANYNISRSGGDLIFKGNASINVRAGSTGANNAEIVFSNTPYLSFKTANSERLRITNTGFVGIGTSTPGRTVDIVSSDTWIRTARTGGNAWLVGTGVQDAYRIYDDTAGAERFRIDTSGRVGIGTSPSTPLHISADGTELRVQTTNNSNFPSFQFRSSGGGTYGGLSFDPNGASALIFTNGNHTERARIDGSGRLLVGTSTARSNFYNGAFTNGPIQVEGTGFDNSGISLIHNSTNAFWSSRLVFAKSNGTTVGSNTLVANGDTLGEIFYLGNDGTEFVEAARISAQVDGTPGANSMPGRIVLSTTASGASSPTERIRLNSRGEFLDFSTGDCIFAGTSQGAGTTYRTFVGVHSRTSTVVGGTISFSVYSNGNVQNTNNSYGALSDIRLKENIVDATSQWDDIKALQVRKYNFKEGQTHTQIGLIAQEVELVSPGLVSESPDRDAEGNDLGTVTKSVNYSVLYMKAVKALQEAMERIETLEAKVAALEGA